MMMLKRALEFDGPIHTRMEKGKWGATVSGAIRITFPEQEPASVRVQFEFQAKQLPENDPGLGADMIFNVLADCFQRPLPTSEDDLFLDE